MKRWRLLTVNRVVRHRVVCRFAILSSFYFMSAVVFLKLTFTVITSDDGDQQPAAIEGPSVSTTFSSTVDDRADPSTSKFEGDNTTESRFLEMFSSSSVIRDASTSPIQTSRPNMADPLTASDVLVVHVTWFYRPNTDFRFHEAVSLLAVQRFVRPKKILFWYDASSTLPTGQWWHFARQSVAHLLPVPVVRPTSVYNRTVEVPEHQSDVFRLSTLDEYGGLYVDLDLIIVRPIDALLRQVVKGDASTASTTVIMGAETPEMLGSGFILSPRPGAEFIRLWRQAYADGFVDADWNRHSVYVPMQLARRRPELVHVEWFTINRPNWYERDWLYTAGRLWDWSGNYAVHLWYRDRPITDVEYDPVTIRTLNTTVGEVFRHIYYGDQRLLHASTKESYGEH